MKQTLLLEQLKKAYKREKSYYRDEYHLKNIELNLFSQPYNGIDERADSIRSSAAMIYNTIGLDSIIIDGKKYGNIIYEREFPVLKNQEYPAKPDVSMLSADGKELILIEAKLLEWIDDPKSMKTAYLSSHCYLPETGFYTTHFIESFRNLKKIPEEKDKKDSTRLLPYYTRYDAVQMNIHILGIYNYCAREKTNCPKIIKLLNIVWDCDVAEEYQMEEREGLEYVASANVSFRNLFKELGVDFSVEYVRYSDFLNRVDWRKDPKRRTYLNRYEIADLLCCPDFDKKFETLWEETKHQGESQTVYEKRMNQDHKDKLMPDAFIKKDSAERYNPKKDEPPYSKPALEKLKHKTGEKWVFLQNQYYTKYAVSNLGRVAFLYNDLYHVLNQDDTNSKGYLKLDPKGKYNVDHQIEVYKLIAMGFLGKQLGDGLDVHHRINDGYNCRPENLILLTREQHNKVHMSEKRHDELINSKK